jgi:hypothetical protein
MTNIRYKTILICILMFMLILTGCLSRAGKIYIVIDAQTGATMKSSAEINNSTPEIPDNR